ncbi:MAG: hypothetical protein ACREC1_06000 [Methylovirgula sp.]
MLILFARGAYIFSTDVAAVLILIGVAADLKLRPNLPGAALSDRLSEILGPRCSVVIKSRRLFQLAGTGPPATRKQLNRMLDRIGVAVEPDWRYDGWSPGANDPIVVFKAEYGAPVDPERPAYHRMKLQIDATALAVAVDEKQRRAGFEALKSDIAATPGISGLERARLLAYAFVSLTSPPKLGRTGVLALR